ncbi:uncharacterized protein LOC127699233, partial [Mytilus californianus]|uniref:uncharacterized protein LOC127699233 n=1 Tax=Mytilus californianus TaxID=6549 RepID=UPI00224538D1
FGTINFNSTKDVTFWAACLVAFFSFFRKSNLLVPSLQDFDPNRHLSRQNIQFHPEGVILHLNKTKTIQFSERSLEVPLPAIRNSPLSSCPAFFFKEGGQIVPLTHSSFLTRLKDSLKEIGIDPTQYSGHSFCRGGASFAFQCGIPGELIQAQGDWKSDTYKRYLDPSFSYQQQVMKSFAKALQQ